MQPYQPSRRGVLLGALAGLLGWPIAAKAESVPPTPVPALPGPCPPEPPVVACFTLVYDCCDRLVTVQDPPPCLSLPPSGPGTLIGL
jgi:hypothetical protein